jgi:hypothetical protein
MKYRFVVCVDINADNLSEAYGRLYVAMDSAADSLQGNWEGWESTDEAYGPDNAGAIHPQTLDDARDAYFMEVTRKLTENDPYRLHVSGDIEEEEDPGSV